MHNETIKNHIFTSLVQYGLNPQDWSSQTQWESKNPLIILKHRDDEEFQLIGHLELQSENPRLKDLQLFSI